MKFFLKFNRIYLIPVWTIIVFYLIPAALGVFFSGNSHAYQLFLLSVLAIFSYCLSYHLFTIQELSSFFSRTKKINNEWRLWAGLVFTVYGLVILYACYHAPQIALVAAFKGASITELSVLREQFLRTGVGLEKIPLYIYTIAITSVIPLIITQLFVSKHKIRFIALGLFVLTLLLTLEKGRALVAMFPLIVLHVNKGNLKKTYSICALLIFIMLVVSLLARGGLSNPGSGSSKDKMAGVPNKYNLFQGESSQAYYLINRIIYIPYMTAIDWLDYKEQILDDRYLYGRSIGLIASVMGWDKISLEREVFSFEWGQNITGTGSANTVYFIDAYLNFNFLGVMLYSFLLALVIKVCVASKNEALLSTLAIPLYYICFHGLSVILFSGGLGFLLLIALFGVKNTNLVLKPKLNFKATNLKQLNNFKGGKSA